MLAVPEMGISDPVAAATGQSTVPAHHRRVVAVAVSAMELLRPESDLVRLVEGFSHVDILLAAEDTPATPPGPLGVLGGADASADEAGYDDEDDDERDEVRDGVAALGLPGLHLHRLGLRTPLGAWVENDLIAAMSELVGFDPEPGVYCLAPAPAPADPGRVAVDRAAQRIAQVYGIPLLRYRCLELSVVDDDGR